MLVTAGAVALSLIGRSGLRLQRQTPGRFRRVSSNQRGFAMNTKAIIRATAAFSTSVGGLAIAQNDKDIRADRAVRGSSDLVVSQASCGDRDRLDHDCNDDRGRPGHDRRGDDGRGAGPNHNFYRGDRLPQERRDRQYVDDDWRGHRLSAPPRGYHWAQTGGGCVLAAIATGIILTILMNQ